MKGRWTSIVALVLAVAGLIVPLALWWADKESHAVTIEVISKAALHLDLPDKMPSVLAVTINGEVVEKPYFSFLELTNEGTQPIAVKDFEHAIQISAGSANILQVQVTEASPKDLQPKIAISNGRFEILPLLLNPGDKFKLSILTSHGAPRFSAAARIAAVRAVDVLDEIDSKQMQRSVVRAVASIILLALYGALFFVFFYNGRYQLKRWAILLGAFGCAVGAALLLGPSAKEFLDNKTGVLIIFAAGLPVLLAGRYMLLRRKDGAP